MNSILWTKLFILIRFTVMLFVSIKINKNVNKLALRTTYCTHSFTIISVIWLDKKYKVVLFFCCKWNHGNMICMSWKILNLIFIIIIIFTVAISNCTIFIIWAFYATNTLLYMVGTEANRKPMQIRKNGRDAAKRDLSVTRPEQVYFEHVVGEPCLNKRRQQEGNYSSPVRIRLLLQLLSCKPQLWGESNVTECTNVKVRRLVCFINLPIKRQDKARTRTNKALQSGPTSTVPDSIEEDVRWQSLW